MSEQNSDAFQNVQNSLNEFKKRLTELSFCDLSNLHVSHEWSWVPYVKDHIDFLIEQTDGLLESLRDSPPPVDASKNEAK